MDSNNILAYALGIAKLPGSLAYLTLRLLNRKETLGTVLQRLGWSSIERRNGPVLWFSVNGLGESSTFLPLIYRCLQEYNEKVIVLVTTPCLDAYKLLGESLPQRVLVQLVPLENPITVSTFLRKWRPQIGVFLETPFHRELAIMARGAGVRLALLNAHMPGDDVLGCYARRTSREMLRRTLRSYSLIVPRTYVDVGRFRMFGATLGQMPGWSTDLQQAAELAACATRLGNHRPPKLRRSLLKRLGERQLWLAANTLPGEDAVVARVHAAVRSRQKRLLTLIAPRVVPSKSSRQGDTGGTNSSAYEAVARRLSAEWRLQVELLSSTVDDPERLSADVDVLLLDDPEVLPALYSLSEIVLVGGSLLPSLDGASSPAAAAVAGCALLMGPHGAEFLGLAADLNHAAVMASEEVAAAVAQTGMTTRGIHPSSFDTPQERERAAYGPPVTPPQMPWLDGSGAGPEAAAGAPGAGTGGLSSMPGSNGRGWSSFTDLQRSLHSIRPMSAPPTAPEYFHMQLLTPPRVLSPFGTFSTGSSAQAGASGGVRNMFIAPFSTPGMTYSLGGSCSPAETRSTGVEQQQQHQCNSEKYATPPSAAAYVVATPRVSSDNHRRRRAIDRFRWASSKNGSIGFGYTDERYTDSDTDCASSTCDSELEEGQMEVKSETRTTYRQRDGCVLEHESSRGRGAFAAAAATVQLAASAKEADADVRGTTSFQQSQIPSPGGRGGNCKQVLDALKPVEPYHAPSTSPADGAPGLQSQLPASPSSRIGAVIVPCPFAPGPCSTEAVLGIGCADMTTAAAASSASPVPYGGVSNSDDDGDFHDAVDLDNDDIDQDFAQALNPEVEMGSIGQHEGQTLSTESPGTLPVAMAGGDYGGKALSALSSGPIAFGKASGTGVQQGLEHAAAALGAHMPAHEGLESAQPKCSDALEAYDAEGGTAKALQGASERGCSLSVIGPVPIERADGISVGLEDRVRVQQGNVVQDLKPEDEVAAVAAAARSVHATAPAPCTSNMQEEGEVFVRKAVADGAVPDRWRQDFSATASHSSLSMVVPAGRDGGVGNNDSGTDDPLASSTELPTLHNGHHNLRNLVIHRGADSGGGNVGSSGSDAEFEWPTRPGGPREPRQQISDPGLPRVSLLQGSLGRHVRGLSLDCPAPSFKSLMIDPARLGLAPQHVGDDNDGDGRAVGPLQASAPVTIAHDCNAGPSIVDNAVKDESPHFCILGGLHDEVTLAETWTSDVSMAAMVEGNRDSSFSGDRTPSTARSLHSSAAATREASGVFPELSRGSLDHYLQVAYQQNLSAASPVASRGRAGRGAPTRLSGRSFSAPLVSSNLTLPRPVNLAEDVYGAVHDGIVEDVKSEAAGVDDTRPAGGVLVQKLDADVLGLPPVLPRIVVGLCDVVVGSIVDVAEEAGDGGSNGQSPTVVSAAVTLADGELMAMNEEEKEAMDYSPTAIAQASGSGSGAAHAADGDPLSCFLSGAPSGNAAAAADTHEDAESPTSDFEFGGSVPDDTGSGSPTLLATASVHNGSGTNLTSGLAVDKSINNSSSNHGNLASPAEPGPQQLSEGPINALAAGSQQSAAALGRPSSRTSSPCSSSNSWRDQAVAASPARGVSEGTGMSSVAPAAATTITRLQDQKPWPLSLSPRLQHKSSAVGFAADNNPYNVGSCFSGQKCFSWLLDGDSHSRATSTSEDAADFGVRIPAGPAMSAAAVSSGRGASVSSTMSLASNSSSRTSMESRPSFHQVASIGSWLDHLGSMLAQPSIALQRSQAQHDPMVWFSQQMAHRDASGGGALAEAALEDVAPGLRAPMHSPLRPASFEDERHSHQYSINPQALASVTTTLFPAAQSAMSYPAPQANPPPSASPSASAANTAVHSSAVKCRSSITSEQVTTAFTMGRSQYAALPTAAATCSGISPDVQSYMSNALKAVPFSSSGGAAATAADTSVPAAAAAAAAAAPSRSTAARDELSALLNSPRSPVSPVRVARILSPAAAAAGHRKPIGLLASPAGAPASVPRSPAATSYSSPRLLSPSQQRAWAVSPGSGDTAASAEAAEGWPLPVPVVDINTPRKGLQTRVSPMSSPLYSRTTGIQRPAKDAIYGVWPTAEASMDALPSHQVLRKPDSAEFSSDSLSSCPNTPRSRVADSASSPFRNPIEQPSVHHNRPVISPLLRPLVACSSPAAPLSPPPPPSVAGGSMLSFEESFEAVVRATPVKSPARSVVGRASAHVSPYSSPYRSPVAAAMVANAGQSSCRNPGPSTTGFRSLFLEEEEELAAGLGCEEMLDEDTFMPLSPRASSQNVLFSMQDVRFGDAGCGGPGQPGDMDDAKTGMWSPSPLLRSTSGVASPLARCFAGPGMSPTSAHQSPLYGAGSVVASTASQSPSATPWVAIPSDVVGCGVTASTSAAATSVAATAIHPTSSNSGVGLTSALTGFAVAVDEARVAGGASSLPTPLIAGGPVSPSSNLDSVPTFSRSLILTDTDDDEGNCSASASPRRAVPPHLAEGLGNRQPRITLSGGLLVVPPVTSAGVLPKSNLSHSSTAQQEESSWSDDFGEDPPTELPATLAVAAATITGASDETHKRRTLKPSSRRVSCSSITGSSSGGCSSGTGVTGTGSSYDAGTTAGKVTDRGSTGSLASSFTAAITVAVPGRDESPPRSPAERTRCPLSACPSASPVKPLLHSAHSSPGPRGYAAADGPQSPLPYLPVLPSQMDNMRNWPPSPPLLSPRASKNTPLPCSPPASYVSPRATDPRASPVKVMTALKRTPVEAAPRSPRRMVTEEIPRMTQFPQPGGRAAAAVSRTDTMFEKSVFAVPTQVVNGIFGGDNPKGDQPSAAALATFSGMAPVRTQAPAAASMSPAAAVGATLAATMAPTTVRTTPAAHASPRCHRSSSQMARQPSSGSGFGSDDIYGPNGDQDDKPPLVSRASCPAGFAALADRRPPPTPRSGRREASARMSPPYGASSHSQILHAQRNQQQQMWDRARAESRNASAAGTPSSARALFIPPSPLHPSPVSFPASSFGLIDASVSPLEPQRSPRAGTSPAHAPVFSLDAATSGIGGAAVAGGIMSASAAHALAEEESWQLQQARFMYQAANAQGTPRSARVLFPPASPGAAGAAVTQAGASLTAAEPPSPSWSQVSRRLFPEGGGRTLTAGPASVLGATATNAGGGTPVHRSTDNLDDVLAHMRVQVASPVSPQPRLPPPPASPRLPCGSAATSIERMDSGTIAAAAAFGGRRSSYPLPSSSPVVHPALQHHGRAMSGSGVPDAPHVCLEGRASVASSGFSSAQSGAAASVGGAGWYPPVLPAGVDAAAAGAAFRSPGAAAAVSTQSGRRPLGSGVSNINVGGDGHSHTATMLPTLPLLPPLPRLRQLPGGVPMIGQIGTSAAAGTWPTLTCGVSDWVELHAACHDPSVDAVRRQLFRQSAPGLSYTVEQASLAPQAAPSSSSCSSGTIPRAGSIPLPGMPVMAEREALAVLESQFKAAEQEAAILPIETRVTTPTSLPPAAVSGTAADIAAVTLTGHSMLSTPPAFSMAAAATASQVGGPLGITSDHQYTARQVAPPSPRSGVTARTAGAIMRSDSSAAGGEKRIEAKPQAQTTVIQGQEIAENSVGPATDAGAGAAVNDLNPSEEETAPSVPGTVERGPSVLPPVGAPGASSPADALGSVSRRQGPGSGRRRAAPRTAAAARGDLHQPRHTEEALVGGTGVSPSHSTAAAAPLLSTSRGGSSPPGLMGARPSSDRLSFIAPCARYADQYLIPPAQVTCDPREGPAVWIVSSEEELAAALNRLLLDTTERQSRGRAAAQGAAQLASSRVATVWNVLEEMVIAPALQKYITSCDARTAT